MFIFVTHTFTVKQDAQTQEYKVSTREYFYKLSDIQDEDEHSKGVFAYHWHPNNSFPVKYPHLHVTITPKLGYSGLELKINRAHYPTSRVCIEDFVRLLVEGYDVRPRFKHQRWSAILHKNKSAFHKHASWSIQNPLS